jgi:hypothetical protein
MGVGMIQVEVQVMATFGSSFKVGLVDDPGACRDYDSGFVF